MNRFAFLALLLSFSIPVFGQQYLWSTSKINPTKVEFEKQIALESVTDEVLKLYDVYKLYYDLSGYNKETFVKNANYGFDKLDWLKEIQDLTVFAIRSNSGNGSFVAVICISKNNVNALIFSNATLKGAGDFIFTMEMEQDKFERWFKTLLN